MLDHMGPTTYGPGEAIGIYVLCVSMHIVYVFPVFQFVCVFLCLNTFRMCISFSLYLSISLSVFVPLTHTRVQSIIILKRYRPYPLSIHNTKIYIHVTATFVVSVRFSTQVSLSFFTILQVLQTIHTEALKRYTLHIHKTHAHYFCFFCGSFLFVIFHVTHMHIFTL